jgi:predicted nucleic acid-binding protein
MRIVVDTNVFVSAALKEKSVPGTAVQIVAESDLLLKSVITEQELFVCHVGSAASCAADPAELSGLAE